MCIILSISSLFQIKAFVNETVRCQTNRFFPEEILIFPYRGFKFVLDVVNYKGVLCLWRWLVY